MVIYKILNNNVVVIKNKDDEEQIVMGRGIAFKKRAGDAINEEMIDKKFKLMDKEANNKFQELLSSMSVEYVELATKIIEYGREKIGENLNDLIYVSLSDHIAGAIERDKMGIKTKNMLYWEIKKFYPREFQVGVDSIKIIKEQKGVELSEDEAGFIALHFVNAQFKENNTAINEITTLMKEIESIVSLVFKIKLDEESVYYYRFITHLKFFAARLFADKIYKNDSSDDLLEIIKLKYNEAYACANKIYGFICKKYNYMLSDEEILYLTIHISRIVSETKNKN